MENSESSMPGNKPVENPRVILGRYRIHTEGKDSSEDQHVLILDAPGKEIPFDVIDEKTNEPVALSKTRVVEVWRIFRQEEPPPKFLEPVKTYYNIKKRKRR